MLPARNLFALHGGTSAQAVGADMLRLRPGTCIYFSVVLMTYTYAFPQDLKKTW